MKKYGIIVCLLFALPLARADCVPDDSQKSSETSLRQECAPADQKKPQDQPTDDQKKKAAARLRRAPHVLPPEPRPSASPSAVRPAMPPIAIPRQIAPPAAPRPLTACDGGGCRDAAGSRYDGGVGNAYLDPNGKLCNRNGNSMQCF